MSTISSAVPAAGVASVVFFLMTRRPPRSTQSRSSAASDVYKRQIVERRTADDGGEHRSLSDSQLGGIDMEVGPGSSLDAVRAATVVDRVEVVLQDRVLGLLLVDLDRDDELFELAGDRLVLGQEVVLDVLLGDGGAALLRSARE